MASLTERLSAHGLDAISMVIEAHATGQHPELCHARSLLSEFRSLLVEAQDAVAGIETGTLTREDAERICWSVEVAPETRRSLTWEIDPPSPTVPCEPPEELLRA